MRELDPVIDEETISELNALPEVSLEDLRIGSFAYKVGVLALKKEHPYLVEVEIKGEEHGQERS